jgi:hypothetical protein
VSVTTRLRSTLAAIATVAALVFTSLGRSPADGPVGGVLLVLWVLGISAGVIAFVAWASVFSDVAQHRAGALQPAERARQSEPAV